MLRSLLLFVFCAAFASSAFAVEVPAGAFGESAVDGDDPRVETRLLFDRARVAPGEAFRVGVLFDMDEHWHIYWRNPGEAAYSTELTPTSEHATFGDMAWPWPHVFQQADGFITTYGYEERVLFEIPAVAAPHAEGELRVDLVADYLACRVDCIPGRVELHRTLPITPEAGADAGVPAEVVELFDTWRAAHPVTAQALGLRWESELSADALRPGDTFALAWGIACDLDDATPCPTLRPPPQGGVAAFVPELHAGLTLGHAQVAPHPDDPGGVVLRIDGRVSPDAFEGDTQRLGGVVRLLDDDGRSLAFEVSRDVRRAPADTPVRDTAGPLLSAAPSEAAPRPGIDAASESSRAAARDLAPNHAGTPSERGDRPSLAWVLLAAFVGGMILNLMPCVLPVLAVKAVGFASLVHEERAHITAHAAAYTAGIVASMLALAGVVLALRATGTAVGWGFQFQHPMYIALVTALVVAFALNLFGVFQVSLDASRVDAAARGAGGLRRSGMEGLLTVVLATPCSAPLLGTAVGFALAAPWAVVLGVFTTLGLGLAAPFVLLTTIPGAARFLPRPGPWMATLKTGLGYCLLLAAVWLLWLLATAWGADATARVLVFLLALAAALQIWGANQYASARRVRATLAVLLACVTAAGVLLLPRAHGDAPPGDTSPSSSSGEIAWQPWSAQAVDDARAANRVVFVDFTADWCITCKVNERQVLETERVRAALDRLDVVTLKGDWTRRDDAIRAELARWGKGGVPLYLVYGPGLDDARVLPELLTPSLVVDALDAAALAR